MGRYGGSGGSSRSNAGSRRNHTIHTDKHTTSKPAENVSIPGTTAAGVVGGLTVLNYWYHKKAQEMGSKDESTVTPLPCENPKRIFEECLTNKQETPESCKRFYDEYKKCLLNN